MGAAVTTEQKAALSPRFKARMAGVLYALEGTAAVVGEVSIRGKFPRDQYVVMFAKDATSDGSSGDKRAVSARSDSSIRCRCSSLLNAQECRTGRGATLIRE